MFAQARQHLRTPRDLLRFCTSRFNQARLSFGHGSDNAHDEAAYLILHTLHLPLDTLEPYLDAALLPEEIDAVLSLAERRVNERLPMAYLTRQAWQGDFEFYVDERVLIPRSFIYEQLGEPIAPWTGDSNQIRRVLDLCTGSGCLAIQAACHYPEAQVDAADLSPEALEVAAINVANYGLEERVRLIQSDLFANLSGTYDLIISNPPYVNAESVAALPANTCTSRKWHSAAAKTASMPPAKSSNTPPASSTRTAYCWWKSATTAKPSKPPSPGSPSSGSNKATAAAAFSCLPASNYWAKNRQNRLILSAAKGYLKTPIRFQVAFRDFRQHKAEALQAG